MKNVIYILLTILLSACFGKKPTIETGHEGKPMPSIDLLLMDSTTHINVKDAAKNQAAILFYFSPYCPYCRAFTKSIIQDIDKLKELRIFMLSSFPLAQVKQYFKEYELSKYPNITCGQDYENYFSQYYKSPGVPCIAIYGKDQILKEVLMGAVSTNLVKDIALE